MISEGPKAHEGDLVRLIVDVKGYLFKGMITLGTDGVVVEAYTEPCEGYAVDVTVGDVLSPKGMEFDNVFLRPDQFEVVPYPCTMHIDAELSSTELAERLAELSNGKAVGDRVDGALCVFELFAKQPPAPDAGRAPDFVDFRYRIHGEARSEVPVEQMAAIVGSILKHFWDEGIGAVALCHYRDLLPRNGGLAE